MKFEGKRDLWWYLFVLVFNVVTFSILIFYKEKSVPIVSIIIFFILIDIVLISYTLNNYIILYKDELMIAFGFQKTYISYSEIISLENTNSKIAGSATSFDRLLIETSQKKVIISPKNKDNFIKEMLLKNKDIKIK